MGTGSDTLRLRNVRCPGCGYAPTPSSLAGVVAEGRLTCPECGGPILFTPEKPVISRRVRLTTRFLSLLGAGIFVALGIFVWQAGGTMIALLYAGAVLVMAMIFRLSVRRLTH